VIRSKKNYFQIRLFQERTVYESSLKFAQGHKEHYRD